jgi:prevent-host-death family protein
MAVKPQVRVENGGHARISATLIRDDLANVVNRVVFGAERIVLERRGKDVAAIVSMEDLTILDELENRIDLDAARKALREHGSIPWEKVKADLGI